MPPKDVPLAFFPLVICCRRCYTEFEVEVALYVADGERVRSRAPQAHCPVCRTAVVGHEQLN